MVFKDFAKKFLSFLIFGVMLFTLTGCDNMSEEEILNEKAINEIKYLDTVFIDILNKLNNITFANYMVTANKATITEESANNEQASNSAEEGNTGEGQTEGTQTEGGTEGSTPKKINSSQMSPNTILSPATTVVDWDFIKGKVENIYSTWATIIIDLYSLNISNDDILGFSESLDIVTKYVKDEDRENSLLAMANLYGYLPKYIEELSTSNAEKNIFKTKSFLLNAYSMVGQDLWEEIRLEIDKAEQSFQIITTDIDFAYERSYRINKAYVLLNELKQSLSSEDKEIFYIKYKNLLEELDELNHK